MKFYNSFGPNPHVVRMFLAEKHLQIPAVEIDVRGAENRREPYLRVNPHGQTPALEFDDGTSICEITAICEYLEDTHPQPPLIGESPREKAECRMWTRRVDLNICEPMTNAFRFGEGLRAFKERIVTVPEAADGLKRIARDRLAWLDRQMDGRDFICGARFTLADVLLFCFVAFGATVGQPLDPANANLVAWFGRIDARPSARA